jgi:ethanolamine ammonia-lyase large subunit
MASKASIDIDALENLIFLVDDAITCGEVVMATETMVQVLEILQEIMDEYRIAEAERGT